MVRRASKQMISQKFSFVNYRFLPWLLFWSIVIKLYQIFVYFLRPMYVLTNMPLMILSKNLQCRNTHTHTHTHTHTYTHTQQGIKAFRKWLQQFNSHRKVAFCTNFYVTVLTKFAAKHINSEMWHHLLTCSPTAHHNQDNDLNSFTTDQSSFSSFFWAALSELLGSLNGFHSSSGASVASGALSMAGIG